MKAFAVDIGTEFAPAKTFPNLGKLISTLLPNVYILAGLLLFALLIFGGFGIIMGAGGDDPKKTEQGKQAVTAAVIGFLLIFLSYLLIRLIEVVTGLDILKSTL
ncbi:MAG: hypothetical protein ACOZBZ_00925 [Patescibacteria group bacterium]